MKGPEALLRGASGLHIGSWEKLAGRDIAEVDGAVIAVTASVSTVRPRAMARMGGFQSQRQHGTDGRRWRLARR